MARTAPPSVMLPVAEVMLNRPVTVIAPAMTTSPAALMTRSLSVAVAPMAPLSVTVPLPVVVRVRLNWSAAVPSMVPGLVIRILPAVDVSAVLAPSNTASLIVRSPATEIVVVPEGLVAVGVGVTVPGGTVLTVVPGPMVVVWPDPRMVKPALPVPTMSPRTKTSPPTAGLEISSDWWRIVATSAAPISTRSALLGPPIWISPPAEACSICDSIEAAPEPLPTTTVPAPPVTAPLIDPPGSRT